MSFYYSSSDPRISPNSLPNIEVFYARIGELGDDKSCGYYWWSCFPGCLPDGEPNGPFTTEEEALNNAQDEG
jgi:hypothetical protein